MAIDVSRDPDFAYTFLERWDVNGHEVALMTLVPKDCPSNGNKIDRFLLCECDFPKDKNKGHDSLNCPAKEHVREKAMRRARERYGSLWSKMTIWEIILDVWKRVTNGEYLGESIIGSVYIQEVAELICSEEQSVRAACEHLFAEEKLDLDGAILVEFVPGFRFPLEMYHFIAHVVEIPLGWPNGDAGMFTLQKIEAEIGKRTRCKSGKDAFGKHFPHIDRKILVPALEWLASILSRTTKNKKQREHLSALSIDEITKDFKWLPQKHPEIKLEFYAEFIKALLEVVLKNVQFEKSPKAQLKELRFWIDFLTKTAKSWEKQ